MFPRLLQACEDVRADGDAGNLVVQEARVARAVERQDAHQHRYRQRTVLRRIAFQKNVSLFRLIDRLRQQEIHTGADFAPQHPHLTLRVRSQKVERAADDEGRGLADVRPGMIHPGVELLLDQFDQA